MAFYRCGMKKSEGGVILPIRNIINKDYFIFYTGYSRSFNYHYEMIIDATKYNKIKLLKQTYTDYPYTVPDNYDIHYQFSAFTYSSTYNKTSYGNNIFSPSTSDIDSKLEGDFPSGFATFQPSLMHGIGLDIWLTTKDGSTAQELKYVSTGEKILLDFELIP